jgi:glutaconate CoA-transferase, subunit A
MSDRSPLSEKFMPLSRLIREHLHNGNSVAMEGFTHLIPFAAGHEVIRQGIKDLTLIRLTPDLIYDQLIGVGAAKKVVFSWGGNPGVGSLHRLRDAVENGYPNPVEIEEHTHAVISNAYVAGASGLPFAVLRAYSANDLGKQNKDTVKYVTCPFTGEELAAVRAINPDVAIIHAQMADRSGNIKLFGISGVQKEAAMAAKKVLVTVEEVVNRFDDNKNDVILPHWLVSGIAVTPGGAKPSYAMGYYKRNNEFYKRWDDIARDRDRFSEWIRDNVLNAEGYDHFYNEIQ